MKKLILVTVAIMGFLFYTTNVSAQTKPATEKTVAKTEQTATTQGKFVDKNNNGVCDKHEGKGEKCKTNANCKANSNCKAAAKGNAHQCGQAKGNGNCSGTQKRDGSCCGQKK
ncbi:MAG: hypothetical protein NTZ33_12505 [Bacteroidetes bacterium]|nr:hypothetical protein [Bacteroidota bacterium]